MSTHDSPTHFNLLNRRQFLRRLGLLGLSAAGLSALSACGPATTTSQSVAPTPTKLARLGFLSSGPAPAGAPVPSGSLLEVFVKALKELGYNEGKNLAIEYRYADGNNEKLTTMAQELAQLKVDVFVTFATPETTAAKQATTSIPIIFAGLADPVSNGIVPSMEKPGGNLTGTANSAAQAGQKRLETLKEALPNISKVAVLHNASNKSNLTTLTAMEETARKLSVQLWAMDVRKADDFSIQFEKAKKEQVQAVLLLGDPLLVNQETRVVELTNQHKLPAISDRKSFVEKGGLMSYGADRPAMYRRAAVYVDKVLKGAKPAELPVELTDQFELIVSLKSATQLGVTVTQSVLTKATEQIQ